jgi:hypothetical protein
MTETAVRPTGRRKAPPVSASVRELSARIAQSMRHQETTMLRRPRMSAALCFVAVLASLCVVATESDAARYRSGKHRSVTTKPRPAAPEAKACRRNRSDPHQQERLSHRLADPLRAGGSALQASQAVSAARIYPRRIEPRRVLWRGGFRQGADQHRLAEHMPGELHQRLQLGILHQRQKLLLCNQSSLQRLSAEPIRAPETEVAVGMASLRLIADIFSSRQRP